MNFNRIWKIGSLFVIAVVIFSAVVWGQAIAAAQPSGPNPPGKGPQVTVAVDIAEDHTRFSFDQTKVYEDGMPAYGSSFVTQGYIYPEGTLDDSAGVLEDGSPEFPELVLGIWSCRGWMIGDGAYTEDEPWVISTQVFQFGELAEGNTVITDGYELPMVNVAISRAIVGGSGLSNDAAGEQVQQLLGFSEYGGVRVRSELIGTGLNVSLLPSAAAGFDYSFSNSGSVQVAELYGRDDE